ncbi:sulfurtransferase-like selenium metabolism protein YedF [Suipraeoptans intestinalis]|uniref:sulfurtransferase-like selenium metabolism protein YedF n=1 Tax=Suipraeoptans intestinalis TaxID=2606628 RepID=UPI0023F0C3AB|nr:sulfurtransferase-like selenium metabolism protein YedF [Suipraeoptans intestinalis]MDD7769436.1 sulfurtransferase-like selenium metabolism protein YedF [Suipraeoptans intestinalis]MDY3121653.1 sulfurtransferase-like selenium metabolism protein YedF [Suipraeoptans intestinalis]
MIQVNAMGDACPIPVIKAKKALQELGGAGVVEVQVDNEIAVQNVTKLGRESGGEVTSEKTGEGAYVVRIQVGEGKEEQIAQAEVSCDVTARKNKIVVVSSDRMGTGNDELGKVLMKGFLFAVSQLDELPQTILFYNGGATLTAEGSDSLEDLKGMEAQGVEIRTCGTCLDYYGLKEKLAVGTVTNMYSIVETMAAADVVLRP